MTKRPAVGGDGPARTVAPGTDAPAPLAESAARLLLALEAAQVDAFCWDLVGDRADGAGALSRELGLAAGGTVAAYLDRVHEQDRERLAGTLRRLSADAPHYTAEYRVRDGSGAYLQVADSGRAQFDDAGRLLRVLGTRRRVGEAERVEQALREGEERYRTLLQAVPSMTFEGDTEGGNMFASEQWCAYTGMTPEQTAGFGWTKAVHPDDLPAAAERWAQAVRDGGPCEMRHRLRAADGSYRWFLLRSRPLRDARGRIERWVGSLTDVDDLLRTERALRESESRYRELVQNANSAIIRWRKDGALTFFNEYAEQFFGYRADEVLGKHVGILVPDQDSDGADLTRLVEDIVRYPDRYRNGVNENICRDGRRVWMSWTNRPIFDEGGTVSEILAIGSDITERLHIERALRYQLHLNQSITDKATDSIIVTDAQGRVTFMNPEAQRVFGYATEELTGQPLHDAIHHHHADGRPFPMSECPLCRVYDSGEVVRDHEGVFFHRDGSQIIVTASNAALEFDGRRVGAALVLHDITERKRAEAALRERTERYELVLAGAQDAIWDWDVEHRRVHFSPQWKTLRGYAEDEVSDREEEWSSGIHPEDAPRVLAAVQAHFDRRTSVFAEEYRIRCKDGSWKWISDRGIAQCDASGRVVRMAGSESDITERKRAEQQISDTSQRLQALMQALPVGVSFSDDLSCQRVTGNPMLLAQFEMRPQDDVSASAAEGDAAGRLVRYFHEGRELRDAELPLQRAAAENRVIPPMQLEVRLPSGRTWFAEVSGAPLHDAQANVIGGLAVVVDITAHVRSERALRESQADLQRAQAVGRIGSWRLDVRRNALSWSAENHRIFGISEGRPLSYESFLSAVHPDDRDFVDRMWQAGLRGEPYDIEHRLLIDGRVKWVREKAELEFDERGGFLGAFGTTQDITDIKLAEQALRDLNERLNTLLGERTRLAEAQAADLRELAGELTRAEQRERDRLYELLHDHVQPLLVAARLSLSGLHPGRPIEGWMRIAADARGHITEALDTARSLSAELNPPLVREQGLGPALEWLGRWALSRHRLEVKLKAEPQAEPADAATRLLLFKATRELLMNVAKHAAASEVMLAMERLPEDMVQITVTDQGVGFDAPGFRSDIGVGDGSGLWNIERRLGMIGGRIEIESAPGAGTRVRLLAPLQGSQPRPERRRAANAARKGG